MSIQKFISRNLPEKAVYWGNPVNNGFGSYNYDSPIEIDCRWEEMVQYIEEDNGETILSRAVVYTNVDLQEKGLLYKGTLLSLMESGMDSAGDIDYTLIQGVFEVKRWGKTPALNSATVFLRKAYLTPFLT